MSGYLIMVVIMFNRVSPHFLPLFFRDYLRYAPFWASWVLIGVLSAGLSVVAQESLSDDDRDAIHAVIQSQLDAFQSDDAVLAFSFASPAIQAQFGSPQNFMAMVKTGYQPVYRPRSVVFGDIVETAGKIVQQVLILDGEGQSVLAIYPMEKQTDESWRIAGCYLTASKAKIL